MSLISRDEVLGRVPGVASGFDPDQTAPFQSLDGASYLSQIARRVGHPEELQHHRVPRPRDPILPAAAQEQDDEHPEFRRVEVVVRGGDHDLVRDSSVPPAPG